MNSIYVRIGNERVGPLSLEGVKEKLSSGAITPQTICWYSGLSDWKAAKEIFPDLFKDVPSFPPEPSGIPQTLMEPVPVISDQVPIPLASLGKRFAGMLLDNLIICIPAFLAEIPLPIIGGCLVGWAYIALSTSSAWEATLGMKIMNLRLVDERGNKVGLGQATGRYFASYLSVLTLGIGYIMPFWDKKRATLHDKLAKTFVVNS